MRFTKGKKIMLAGIIAGALFVGLCGNAAYDIVAVNAGEQVSEYQVESGRLRMRSVEDYYYESSAAD